MEDRKFTLRLGGEESAAIGELKELFPGKTDTGIIRFIICNYRSLCNDLKKAREDTVNLEIQLSGLRRKVRTFNQALSAIQGIESCSGDAGRPSSTEPVSG
jgi:hypothetical protein